MVAHLECVELDIDTLQIDLQAAFSTDYHSEIEPKTFSYLTVKCIRN